MGDLIYLSSWRSPSENQRAAARQEALEEAERMNTFIGLREKLRAYTRHLPEPVTPRIFGWQPDTLGEKVIGWHNEKANVKVGQYQISECNVTYIMYGEKCHEYQGVNMIELIVAFENGLAADLLDSAGIKSRDSS